MCKRTLLLQILIFLLIIIFIVFFSSQFLDFDIGNSEFGTYTYERSFTINGSHYEILQSGESNFQYYHDINGFVLLKESTGIYYATLNNDGKVVSSGVDVQGATKWEIARINKITRNDINVAKNAEFAYEFADDKAPSILENLKNSDDTSSVTNTSEKLIIKNLVIFISFAGETGLKNELSASADTIVASRLNGIDNSMLDYYSDISNGYIEVESLLPNSGGSISYIYQNGYQRSYYAVTSSVTRTLREAQLLTDAVNSAKTKFANFDDYDLDLDDDGNIDSVSFILSGADNNVHGGLLWPHAWNLELITESVGITPPKINDLDVAKYTFNFVSDFTYGVVCHEFGHVLGAPDLYHSTSDFVPVGNWDLMATNLDTPQYPLVYTRDTYFGGIDGSSIITISNSGVYSLKPVTTASNSDPIAIKIPTSRANEYFMAEYRNPEVSAPYDAGLSGTGLIVYRINTNAKEGNLYAKYRDSSNPDEVYIFRPSVATGTTYNKSRADLVYAALSPTNPYFSSIGKQTGASNYDYNSLHFVDGSNSGIIIETISIDDGSIDFIVKLNSQDIVDSNYFDDKIELQNPQFVNTTFSGVSVYMNIKNPIDLESILSISIDLKTSTNQIVATNNLNRLALYNSYNLGDSTFHSPFVINNKGQLVFSIFSQGLIDKNLTPKKAVLSVIDADKSTHLFELEISTFNLDWDDVLATALESTPSVYAGARLSAGIRIDGSIAITTPLTVGQWDITNPLYSASKIAAGLTHTLVLRNDLTVYATGSNSYDEINTSDWEGIVDIAAGHYTSYGLKSDGSVVAVGLNNKGQTSISSWSDIIAIAAGARHIVGLKKDGTVVTAGETGDKLNTSDWRDVKAISAGAAFTVGLTLTGRILIAGSLTNSETLKNWNSIERISAGADFLYGLTHEGRVLAIGGNSYGQCETTQLMDIISIAAGERHGIFLRVDGSVLFVGNGNDSYATNEPIPNLIYNSYIEVSAVNISLSSNLVEPGSTVTSNVEFLPANPTYKALSYSSSNELVAVVNNYGVVVAVGVGIAMISVESLQSGVSDSTPIEVAILTPPSSISFNSNSYALIVGSQINLGYNITPLGARVNLELITWEISDTSLCEISTAGVLTAKDKTGVASVTIWYIDPSLNIILSATCTVAISNTITALEWVVKPTKSVYKYSEQLDLQGGFIKITTVYGDITNTLTDLPALIVEGFNSSVLSSKSTVTIRYFDFLLTFDVSIVDYALSVEFQEFPKSEFLYGDEFSTGAGSVKWHLASGSTLVSQLNDSTVSGYNKYSVGITTLTVNLSYLNDLFELTYNVKISDFVTKIDANIIDDEYEFWASFTHIGFFYATMKSGAVLDISITHATISGFNSNKTGYQTVSVSYIDEATKIQFTDSKIIRVLTPSVSLLLAGADESGDYRYLVSSITPYISANAMVNGLTVSLELLENKGIWYEIYNFNSTLSECSPEIRVCVLSDSGNGYDVLLTIEIHAKVIQEFIGALTGNKNQYMFGEYVDIKLLITPINSIFPAYEITPTTDMISYQPTLIGKPQEFRVSYVGHEFSTTITILNYITSVFVENDDTIIYGDALNITIWASMAYGDNLNITSDSDYTFDVSLLGLGTHNIPFTYSGAEIGFSGSHYFTITIIDAEESISLKELVTDTIWFPYGYNFTPELSFTIIMRSGVTKSIDFSLEYFTCKPQYNPTTLENQSIVITYSPLKIAFPAINFIAKNFVSALSIDSISQTEYKYGANLSIFVTGIYADGTKTSIPNQGVNQVGYTTNYNPQKVGVQIITISYIDTVRPNIIVTTTFNVVVNNNASSIIISKMPAKNIYNYGEALSFAGGEVQITFVNGDRATYSDSSVLSNLSISFNPLIPGNQEVVLTKGGKSASFLVTISNLANENNLIYTESAHIKLNYINKTILTSEPLSYAYLKSALGSPLYFDIILKTPTGELQPSDQFEEVISPSSRVCVINKAGVIVREYLIWLAGDANYDGVFDELDLDELAIQYLNKSANIDIADYDLNGSFSLTDLVNWSKKAAKSADNTTPSKSTNYVLPDKLIKREELVCNE
ncbi:MAG: M6 family metalloprotease domain-containing protein [Christensenellaceae bacterium]|jgi:M6 family metalloprotease-like protein|nr:M6 family metalloprotease domain-containing protein [Christensenellaceae bacterium]